MIIGEEEAPNERSLLSVFGCEGGVRVFGEMRKKVASTMQFLPPFFGGKAAWCLPYIRLIFLPFRSSGRCPKNEYFSFLKIPVSVPIYEKQSRYHT